MSLPFFDLLARLFPQSPVDIIAKASIQDVFRHHPAIRTIHPFSKANVTGLFGWLRYGKRLQRQGPYELFITLAPSFSAALIGYGVGSRFRVGYRGDGRSLLLTHRFAPPSATHRVVAYARLLQKFLMGLQGSEYVPQDAPIALRFPLSEEERRTSLLPRDPQTRYIVLNVNSEAQSRRLPLNTWIALGKRLLQETSRRVKLILIGTAAEQPRVAQVLQGIAKPEALLDFSGKTSVRELAMLLRDADLVVSNDSGPMHLANAVGTSLITWFGAGDPTATGPFLSHKAQVFQKPLPCSPCLRNVCRFPTVRCLEQITPDELFQSVMTLLTM
ncbi:hypothetical protein GF339_07155 [candidate division KSB3 bacterium]|uniref:Lipopolysaccharide heptosyltransferase II n=1 Tax=candidate division KSB3 bacterium TaxID=2044937 RepID=A0A9D5Q5Y6_9BACT|nr:hypothetical protein [candidate division KSB3 bacterium]MBD3324346.1 hypothetical protein [candidate division KSB3 bacterium]